MTCAIYGLNYFMVLITQINGNKNLGQILNSKVMVDRYITNCIIKCLSLEHL